LIWVLGSHDLRVADRAAELWKAGLAPRILMSGGLGNFTQGVFEKPEAELLAERAKALGVPGEALLIENRSTNCGENVAFSRELLESRGIGVERVIAVQKPYMERRTWATIRAQWPEVEVRVTSPQMTFAEYTAGEIGPDRVTTIMVGDLQRIWEYPKRGFMIEQEVPAGVREAWEVLVRAGFDGHLV
jgi:uncharacterized SAM-binding protein YcdF (DUF218 family)